MVSMLIVVLDNTVLNIALPTIQRDLGASQSQLVWAVDSYILMFAALPFTWGALGDRFGRKRILLLGLLLFGIGSALSAVASSPAQLIGFRALMGAGGAATLPVTLAIITVVFPPAERGRAIGTWAGAVGGALALGPVLGGLLLENPQWFRWLIGNDWGSVFLISVPVIAIGMVAIARVVPETRNPDRQPLDAVGLGLSIVGLLLMMYGIIHAGDAHDWLAPSVVGPIAGGVVVLAVFVLMERHSSHRSFDVTLFRSRPYGVSLTAVSMAFFAMAGVTFTLPFYLQVLRGYSTLEAGLCFLPFAVAQLLAAPRSARMVARFGERAVITTGLTILLVSLVGLTRIGPSTPLWALLTLFFVFGSGMGNVIAPCTTMMQNVLPLARVGAGSAVQNTVRQVAGALGVAIVGTVLITRYAGDLAPSVHALPATFGPESQAALTSVAAVPAVLAKAAQREVPHQLIESLRSAAFSSFMAASQVATCISAAMVLVADAVVLTLLPRRVDVSASIR